MSDEIKEILDRLFVYKNENNEMKYQPEDILTIDDVWLLLDYITNLQERFDALLEAHKIADELETEFQERNEKAIEFMKENCDIITLNNGWIIRSELTTTGLGELFKILKGGDKDVYKDR